MNIPRFVMQGRESEGSPGGLGFVVLFAPLSGNAQTDGESAQHSSENPIEPGLPGVITRAIAPQGGDSQATLVESP